MRSWRLFDTAGTMTTKYFIGMLIPNLIIDNLVVHKDCEIADEILDPKSEYYYQRKYIRKQPKKIISYILYYSKTIWYPKLIAGNTVRFLGYSPFIHTQYLLDYLQFKATKNSGSCKTAIPRWINRKIQETVIMYGYFDYNSCINPGCYS